MRAYHDDLTQDQFLDAMWKRREPVTPVSRGEYPILRAGEVAPKARVNVEKLPAKLRSAR